MKLLTGVYDSTVDDKGRFILPSRMRQAIDSKSLYVLPGFDENHIMMMTPAYFEDRFSQAVFSSDDAMFSEGKRNLVRRLISPAIELDLDSAGRINIPPRMRERYELGNKTQIKIVGVGNAIEVWNASLYDEMMEREEEKESLSDLASRLMER